MIKPISFFYSCLKVRQVFYFVAGSTAFLAVQSCSSDLSDPQKIVDNAIRLYGGEKYLSSTIEFDFRNRHYLTKREGGRFSKERSLKDSTSTIHDILTNDSFVRKIDDKVVVIPDSMAKKYTASVNSVIYFALLPYGLNDPAVKKKFLGTTNLEGQPYYKVEVSFGEGGGEGYRDTFYYWIHQQNFTVDYMAYFFEEDHTWDMRFRKAMNRREVNGIMFQDYINYKPKVQDKKLEDVEELFRSGQLEELSRIVLENIAVR